MTISVTTPALVSQSVGPQGRAAAVSVSDTMVYNDLRALTDLKTQSREDPKAALQAVSKQFESLFVNMMMQAMRDALPEDSLFGGSQLRTYQEMFDQQLALDLSGNGSLGLAKLIERQLTQTLASQSE